MQCSKGLYIQSFADWILWSAGDAIYLHCWSSYCDLDREGKRTRLLLLIPEENLEKLKSLKELDCFE